LLKSCRIDNIELDSYSDVNNYHSDSSVSFFNYNFKFLFSTLNLLVNTNNLSLKLIIIDLQNKKVNEHVFNLIFQVIIERFLILEQEQE